MITVNNYKTEIQSDMLTISHGCEEFLVKDQFINKLIKSYSVRKPLNVKLGLDPTAPDIHLGHTIVLNKIRQLQNLGHTIIFLIGDFTSLIGDPSGRDMARPLLTKEQIFLNAKTYETQISFILDMERTKIRYNSEWYNLLGANGLIQLSSHYTVARMMERSDFCQRFKKEMPISISEFLYPLMQGYDSVVINSDLEIGGTDQKFNLLIGRSLQKEYGQEPQCILTMPLLIGIDGIEKMSKSNSNYIGISESADSMFGKLMSISDTLMWKYFDLLSFLLLTNSTEIKNKIDNGCNRRDIKMILAREITERFHSKKIAEAALENFISKFCKNSIPKYIHEVNIGNSPMGIVKVLFESGLVSSNSEAKRNIEQGGIKINGDRIDNKSLELKKGIYTVQAGKHKFLRVILN